ncbi:MAG: YkvA family protein [Cyanobacteria bacterium J06632_22]
MKNALTKALHDGYRKLLRHSKYRWIVVLGTLLYLVSPLDISPDVFPVIGWIDDGLIATLLVTEVSQIVTDQLKTRREQVKATDKNAERSPDSTSSGPSEIPSIIDVEAIPVA